MRIGITDEQVITSYLQEKIGEMLPDAITLPINSDSVKSAIILQNAKDHHKSMRVAVSNTVDSAWQMDQEIDKVMDAVMAVVGDNVMVTENKTDEVKSFPGTYSIELRIDDTPAIVKRRLQENDPEIYEKAKEKAQQLGR